eukprot:209775_1
MSANCIKSWKIVINCPRLFRYSKRALSDSIQRNINKKFQKIQLQQQLLTGRYLWGIPYISTSSIEPILHDYYYQLTKLLCDHSTSLFSLSDNFDEEILEFILERGSYPGIPLFHTYRQHKLSSFDDGFITPQSIHIQLTNLSLSLPIKNYVIYNEYNSDQHESDDEEIQDINALKEKLSKIYKNKDALEEALKKLQTENESVKPKTKSKPKSKSKSKVSEIEFDIDLMNDEPIPIYLQCGMHIYHGSEHDNINDVINNNRFEPNLVSDFIDINAADWNRLFHWKLITRTPIGYIECNDNCDKLKNSLDKILVTNNDDEFMNVLNCYRASQNFRLQTATDVSLWKVLAANEATL